MNPDKKKHSGNSEKGKSVDEILAEMDSCNQKIRKNVRKILENVTEMGVEANKINSILRELKELFQES